MSSTFGKPVNNLRTTVASTHALGASTLVLAAGAGALLGSLAAGRVFRVVALTDSGLTTETILSVLEATGISTDTLTGVTAVEGTTNVALTVDTEIEVRVTAKYLSEVQDALNAAEVTISGLGSASTHPASDFLAPSGNGSDLTGITESQVTNLVSDLALKAPLASPSFTGTTTIGTLSGLLKAATGVVSAASAGTDYLSPSGDGSTLTGIAESQVTNLVSDLAAKATDNLVLHLAGTETITGAKAFTTANVTITDVNLVLGTTTGTKIGTATSQKLAFYNSTPIVKPTGSALTALSDLGLIASPTLAESDIANLVSDLALKAPLASPSFTGTTTIGTLSGLLKAATGVVSAASAGTDYLSPSGDGSALTNLSASALASGTVPTARLGSGSASSSTFLRGDQSWAAAGGSASASSGVYASRPSAGTAGNIYLPTDGVALFEDTGSVWKSFGPIFPLTEPPTSSWTWVNQGASTTATSGGIVTVTLNSTTSSGLIRTAPATPYTITAIFATTANTSQTLAGLIFAAAGGNAVMFGTDSSLSGIGIYKLVSNLGYSSSYATLIAFNALSVRFWRISDDGTNRRCWTSQDGINFTLVHTVGRTDYITADSVGFMLSGTPANSTPMTISLLSWAVA